MTASKALFACILCSFIFLEVGRLPRLSPRHWPVLPGTSNRHGGCSDVLTAACRGGDRREMAAIPFCSPFL